MDLRLNRIPETVRRVHLIAVGGTAMGALACLLQELGCEVRGSDRKIYPPMSGFLAARGIPVLEGFRPEHLDPAPDLVVIGNAVTAANPEAVECARRGIPFCSLPQAVNRFAARGKRALVVVGTHGKTTTSALCAWILHAAGRDPSFLIGGILVDFESNFRLGAGGEIVLEGDEYDTAFFDKGPKFLHYEPARLIWTSLEFDHADIYRDLAAVESAFGRLLERLAPECRLFARDGEPAMDRLLGATPAAVSRYGMNPGSDWRIEILPAGEGFRRFEVFKGKTFYGRFRTRLIGRHNLLNALAAIALAESLGVGPQDAARALESFRGVKRRQEVRGEKRGVLVIDDFAHHPTAVRETIAAVAEAYPRRRIVAVFEPRSNTSMRNVFQEVYPQAFRGADSVLVREIALPEKVPPAERFSAARLADALRAQGREALSFADTEGILEHLLHTARPGDVVLIMSNGGFDNLPERLLAAL
ncbi:MAG: Mur ligase domain-containing protein [Desulfobacterales bacterium]